jgi:hypothetical protein
MWFAFIYICINKIKFVPYLMTAYFSLSSYSRIVSVMFIKSFEVLFTASLLCMYTAYMLFFKGSFCEPRGFEAALWAVPLTSHYTDGRVTDHGGSRNVIFLFVCLFTELSILKRASIYRISCVNCALRLRY